MTQFFFRNWAEVIFLILLIIGFLFSLLAPSAVLSYLMIFAAGMIGGRLIYERRKSMVAPYVLIVIGFLIGFLIGSRYGEWKITTVLFIVGVLLSYYMHKTGIIRDIRLWS